MEVVEGNVEVIGTVTAFVNAESNEGMANVRLAYSTWFDPNPSSKRSTTFCTPSNLESFSSFIGLLYQEWSRDATVSGMFAIEKPSYSGFKNPVASF